ncbi:reprolysin-like metallopeptidase [Flavobacterium sp. GT3R68]|uniref:reprolysin-like metallopeptidase n=1 Tax=Flavobacterium sp. GT3R68 TaxID=2594437 RepID=UPI000F8681D8|nr:GEVED domain-containing protein [Flavobacterium sp. GT3R68]RTY86605.1 T9SS type A sorting domain-containing protein [Flavobacterium sp. GSN2]TRW92642.1 T9SS type A sorting domain-containing protein [Flavobacterium sp. GT3R68]
MKKLICAALLFISTFAIAQSKNDLWKKSDARETSGKITKSHLPQKNTFDLDLPEMKKMLGKSPNRETFNTTSNTIITLPNGEGKMESFKVYENTVMAPELAAKYPDIKSYVAVGVDNPNARAYFSCSALGFKSMALYPNKETVFIEPVSSDNATYTVYKKSDKESTLDKFECGVIDTEMKTFRQSTNTFARGADDGKLRTFRLAVSCTGEYAAYFGGTKALALAAMVNTITRLNGVFERDFSVRLVLIANNDSVIYTSAITDPYTDASTYWGSQLQSNLTAVIGEANYDIGHLFGGTTAGGNANCIGCVGIDGSKGSGYTGKSIPSGDSFDIDYVAHEMGHQLGATHTFTYRTESENTSQMEPGSGSTIMGYAGHASYNLQSHSDDYFHAISIQQVTDNIKTKTSATVISTGNATPIVNAGTDYTIPKGTPFMLTGSATDANNDNLTYTWEEMDLGTATTTSPISTATTGPIFRSYLPTTSPTRYFPTMNSILTGLTSTPNSPVSATFNVETLPGVARILSLRLTVRDNRAGGSANNTDDMVVTVNGIAGPFTVDTQNTVVSYAAGTSQVISWTVAGTNANGVNCANVDILLSTDGGQTFPIVLLAGTPNDGAQSIVIPNMPGATNRIMVKGSNHIFFDVNNANLTITGSGSADITAPTASTLSASGTTTSGTNLSWTVATDNTGVTGYNIYQNGVLTTTTTATSLAVSSLSASTTYTFYVKAKDATGNVSTASNTANVTTLAAADTTIPTASTLSASGTTTSATNLSWSAATDNVGVTGYNVYQNGVLKTTTTATTLAVSGLSASTTYTFYVKSKDAAGNVSSPSNTSNVTTLAPAADTTVPSVSTLTASGTTITATNLSWSAATDNVGVTGYNVYQNGVLKTTTTATTLAVSGLSASTTYTFYVKSKDAAGNLSANSNTVNVTTLSNSVTYCNSTGSTAREFINRVQLGSINNLSGNNNGYGNYTAFSTNLSSGSTALMTITPAWNGMSANEAYCVWIDYNHDGTFGPDELVFSQSKTKSTSVSGSFIIPSTAVSGITRMRVSMKYNAPPTACETFTNGEVEDYTVNIITGATAKPETDNENVGESVKVDDSETENKEVSRPAFKLYPNPVKGETLNFSGFESNTSYTIYNLTGQQVANGDTDNKSINVGALTSGIYIIQVTDGALVRTKRFIKE